MSSWIAKKLIGSRNDRQLRKMRPLVARINEYEKQLQGQSEDELRAHTRRWQAELRVFHPELIPPRHELTRGTPEQIDQVIAAAQSQLEGLAKAGVRLDATLRDQLAQAKEPEAKLEALSAVREAILEVESDLLKRSSQRLEEILPEAFAVVKNAARRLCGKSWQVMAHEQLWEMVHFDVQLMGGIALHGGSIAEMQTGEGKTLVSTLPTYLNALTGRGVHVITVNDYLARRDSEWVGGLHRYLGLTVGCIASQMPPPERRSQYDCDITYGTAAEFGFDYLRDNGTATSLDAQVQRGHFFAIVDEVDSILIDEARTPLIISGPATVSTHQFDRWKPLINDLTRHQTNLVNNLITQAKAKLEAGEDQAAGLLLWQASCGMPRNRGFLRMMEEPKARKVMEQAELFLLQDPRKKQLFELQAELYFTTDEKRHEADLTEKGREILDPGNPDSFVLPDLTDRFAQIDQDANLEAAAKADARAAVEQEVDESSQRIHNISQLLKAYCLYEKDVHYVISPNEKGEHKVVIVDQNTGREMPGRRWSDGLHQAVEAKEGVKIEGETQTYATITIQNYFRLYEKLAGMTGTAETESAEFHDIYKLDVLVVPTNRANQRRDENDRVYKTKREKFKSVIERIREAHESGQPVLVGTASVEASETLSRMLRAQKIKHAVLNAKQHRQEAEIVAEAGQRGAVTVSTNMAGRGTDIKLGEGVADLGGLLVLGTERHESRRTDRQLRGRSARQGDPGRSVFYLSFEDDLMRNYGASDRMTKMMELFKIEEGQELQSGMLTKSVEVAQKRVEQRNYQGRKHVLEYDDVLNQQRGVIYAQRNAVLRVDDPFDLLWDNVDEEIQRRAGLYLDGPETERSPQELLDWVNDTFPLHLAEAEADFGLKDATRAAEDISARVRETMSTRLKDVAPERGAEIARSVQLNAIDRLWQEHLYNMDALKQGVFLRAKGQRDPLVEYKTEAYTLFEELMNNIGSEISSNLFRSAQRMLDFERQLRLLSQQRVAAQQQALQQAPPARGQIDGSNLAITGGAELWQLLQNQFNASEAAKRNSQTAKPGDEPNNPSKQAAAETPAPTTAANSPAADSPAADSPIEPPTAANPSAGEQKPD